MKQKARISALLALLMILLPISQSSAYVLSPCKQQFDLPRQVSFCWGGEAGQSGSIWQNAYLSAAASWSSAQSYIAWYNVSSSRNMMTTFFHIDPALYGEAEITYNLTTRYITQCVMKLNTYSLGGKSANFRQSVACHEQGHGFGLGDENSISPAVMNQNRNREVIYTPQSDDLLGIYALYGSGGVDKLPGSTSHR